MKKLAISLGLFLVTIAPLVTMAHPGHGESEGYTIIHYFTEPMHAVITLGSLLMVFAGLRYFRKRDAGSQK
ncbi:MAG: hypothetical protein I8H66_00390 [Sphingobacteriia bacterium]|nr:hypothetical protein [Sphingobacteriia bacterium]